MESARALAPLWNRADEWARRLALAREARRFLYLSTYYLEHDAYGLALLDALDTAAARGVAVTLLIDGFGQRLGGVLMSRAAKAALAGRIAALQRAGAAVTTYRPGWPVQRWLGGGQHVKIQVSDAGEAIFGSSNITRSSFEGWNEYSVWVRGPIARTLLASLAAIGGRVDPAHLDALEGLAFGGTDADDIALDYWFCNPNLHQGALGPLGWTGANLVTTRLVEMIASARASIALTSFYVKPVEPLVAALVDAARRGVDVTLYHSHRDALPATELAWVAAAAHYNRLLDAGVRVVENRHGEHSKIVLVDRAWAAFGSYNLEHAAHDRLAEAMLASRDPRAVDPVLAIVAGLERDPDNVPVTRAALRALPARLRWKRRLCGPFKRWL